MLFPLKVFWDKKKNVTATADETQQKEDDMSCAHSPTEHASQEEDNRPWLKSTAHPKVHKHRHGYWEMNRGRGSGYIWEGKGGAGLDFTRFADSRKGGGNAMG